VAHWLGELHQTEEDSSAGGGDSLPGWLLIQTGPVAAEKTYVVVEAYGHNGKTSIKFLPYEQIKHIEFMEESEEGRGRHTIKALPTSVTYDEDFLGV